jgi:formimidoylglutamate deiminase
MAVLPQVGMTPMTTLFAGTALLPEGWAKDVRVTIAEGRIASVEAGVAPGPGDARLGDVALLPALCNLHSHGFQRAMAGMTERRGPGADSFWTWRELMYRFLDVLDPDDIEAIAALVYVEMLEAGFAAVAEFHYLHNQPGGAPYDDPAELSHRIVAAAAATGIGMTLLPVLYSYGGAGGAELNGGQRRFGCDLETFLRLRERAGAGLAADGVLGTAPHSLRATMPEQLEALVAAVPEGPMHIHAAEQVPEVEQVTTWLGARPVAFLLDRVGLGERWCLIHATQMTEDETGRLAASGAVAGLCPITEANLGDGIFNGASYLAAQGRIGVGSDSNIRISLAEELRGLEYSQRLAQRARNVMAAPGESVGGTLYRAALAGGAQALGRPGGTLAPGAVADLVAIDRGHAVLTVLDDDELLDGWLFAADDRVVREVWSAGRHVVRDGRHVGRAAVEARYRQRMRGVLERI